MSNMEPRLPSGIQAVVDVIGEPAARRFAERFGGHKCYIPKRPRSSHPFAVVLGPELFGRLCAELGGTRMHLPREVRPRVQRKQEVLRLAETTALTPRQIADRAGCTLRYVQMLLGSNRGGCDAR